MMPPAGAGSGNAISSVSSNTSPLGLRRPDVRLGRRRVEARQHRVDVVLVVADDRLGCRRRCGGGAGFGAAEPASAPAQSPTAEYPSSRPASRRPAGLAGFSAAAGLASSSAMMRRIDARISSIEGSWTFAGCVISDSTSKPFYTKATKELPVPDMQAGIFIAQARLVPRSSPPAASRAGPAPLKATPTRVREMQRRGPRIAQLAPETVRHGHN